MIAKKVLETLYLKEGKSKQDIADRLGCSLHKVSYWMDKHLIMARSISDAIYLKRNPTGDPFKVTAPKTKEEYKLLGMGLGLYWGEGTRSDKACIKLGNTDPYLITIFITFLEKRYQVSKKNLKFGLQIFSDMNPQKALKFWTEHLKVDKSQFQKVIVTPSRGIGTYRKKSKYGVLTVHCNNKKLRQILGRELVEYGFSEKPE